MDDEIYYSNPAPQVLWDTARATGDVLIVTLNADDPISHLLVIDRETLNDAFRNTEGDLVALALANRDPIEVALTKAWREDRHQELVEIGGPGHLVHLRLQLSDFG